jgi:hypothetical protein
VNAAKAPRPIDNVLARLERVRQFGDGYRAECPSHRGRSQSLSIKEGSDGCVLVRCFSGCPAAQIVEAFGLRLSDLFVPHTTSAATKRSRPINGRQAVRDAVERIRDREEAALGFRPAVQTRHVRQARATLTRIHGLGFQTVPMPWWESEPHSNDPAWVACVSRALEEQAFTSAVDVPWLRAFAARSPVVATKVLARAAAILRSCAAAAA